METQMIEDKDTSALIVAKPSRIRDSLRALLRATPSVNVITQVDDGSSALEMIMAHHPTLMLLGSNLPDDELKTVLKQTKATQPQTRCIVLAATSQQEWIARNFGADSVLFAGFPAAAFFTTIEQLLSEQNGI